jgi:uncharacterized protein YjbI with pentapeptide repeats
LVIQLDDRLAFGWSVYGSGDRTAASLIVKATFELVPDEPCRWFGKPRPLSGDVFLSDELHYSSDFALYKPKADCVLLATAYVPDGRATTELIARFRVGALTKTLRVFGDRTIHRDSANTITYTTPKPFTSVPISYRRAYGGKAFMRNPIGTGAATEVAANVELVDPALDGREPSVAGFGPIPTSWHPRAGMVGTYDEAWLTTRWPWFPADFDWNYFNAAPTDQQIAGFLRGDERLEFENLHPTRALYRSQLAGVRACCCFHQRSTNGSLAFREVPLNLDTLWINLHEEQLVLVWHGIAKVHSPKLTDIEQVFIFAEDIAQPVPTQEREAFVTERFQETRQVVGRPPAHDAAPLLEDLKIDPSMLDIDNEIAIEEGELDKYVADASAALEKQRAELAAAGIHVKPVEPSVGFAQIRADLARAKAELMNPAPAQAAQVQEQIDVLREVENELTATESEFETHARVISADGPKPQWNREAVADALRSDTKVLVLNQADMQLSDLDLSGIDLSHSILRNANLQRTKLVRARLVSVDLSGADLTGADLTGATVDDTDLTGANLRETSWRGASLNGSLLANANAQRSSFESCSGTGTDFSKSDLTGAAFTSANLPDGDFTGARLDDANFSDAQLQGAQFWGCHAVNVNMAGVNLTRAKGGEKADFSGANFSGAQADSSIWQQSVLDGANFSRATLRRAQLGECSLRRINFDRCDLSSAMFDDALLDNAILTNANLMRSVFDRARLVGVDLSGSNLYEAGFWEALVVDTKLVNANMKSTLLAQGHGYRTAIEG